MDTELISAKHLGADGCLEISCLWQDNAITALLFHPNPKEGGTMHNKVVSTLFRHCRDQGYNVVRYNSRGVGQSSGVATASVLELADALCVVEHITAYSDSPTQFWLGGFSFGGYMACLVADKLRRQGVPVVRLALIAPSLGRLFAGQVKGDDDVNARLFTANLPNTGLPSANLPNTDWSNVDLPSVDLSRADAPNTQLSSTHLSNIPVSSTPVSSANADFLGDDVLLDDVLLSSPKGLNVSNALSNPNVKNSNVKNPNVKSPNANANLSNMHSSTINSPNTSATKANATKASLSKANTTKADFAHLAIDWRSAFLIYGDNDRLVSPAFLQTVATNLGLPHAVFLQTGHFFDKKLVQLKQVLAYFDQFDPHNSDIRTI